MVRVSQGSLLQDAVIMSDDNADIDGPNRRTWDRLNVRRRMLLEFANGDILIGHSQDISLRGVLLQTDDLPATDVLGAAATLFLVGGDGQPSTGYSCQVVRFVGDCIALELDQKVAAAFANRITRDLLKR